MKKLIVLGGINMDLIVKTDDIPQKGKTALASSLTFKPGGKGLNQAIAARKSGNQITLVGKIGSDDFGKDLIKFLKNESINLDFLTISQNNKTGIALVTVDKKSDNTIVFLPASNDDLSPNDIEQIKFNKGDIALTTFEIPTKTSYEFFKKAKKAGALTVLNPSPAIPIKNKIFNLTDFLVLNETELAFYTNSHITENLDTITRLVKKIRIFPKQIVIVTLGSKGSLALKNKNIIFAKAFKVNPVESTGAGDCFLGALISALAKDSNLEKALIFANAAAAISVQNIGANAPTKSQVETFLKEHKTK